MSDAPAPDAGRAEAGGLPLAWRLQVLLVGLIVVMAGALVGLASREVRKSLLRAEEARVARAAARVALLLEQSAAGSLAQVEATAASEPVLRYLREGGAEAEEALRARALEARQGPRRLTIWDAEGRVALDLPAPGAAPAPPAEPVPMVPPVSEPPVPGFGPLREADGRPFADIVVAVRDPGSARDEAPDARALGHVGVRAPVRLSPPGILTQLIGENMTILLGDPAAGRWTDFQEMVPAPPGFARERAPGEPISAFAPIPGTPWLVWAEVPWNGVLAPAAEFTRRITLVAVGIGALALAIAHVIARRHVTQPVKRLTTAVEAIAAGDYSRRIEIRGASELERLGRGVSAMAARIETDLAARRAAEESLRRREEHFRQLFAGNPLPMWVYDAGSLRFLEVNEAATRLYGWSRDEFLALRITDIRPEEEVPRLLERLGAPREDLAMSSGWRHRTKSGQLLEVEISSHVIDFDGRRAVLVAVHDVTDRRALEEQLREAQRLESIGRLAGGVAHDFNNVLTAILGFTEMARLGLPEGSPCADDLEQVRQAADRAAGLTRQLLAFGRRQVLQPRVIDVHAAVRDAAPLIRKLIPENIALVTPLPPRPVLTHMDPGQFDQILINLAANAGDAMPRGGTLTIESAEITLDDSYARSHPSVSPGRYAMVAVSDTGVGMSRDVALRVFEPFFTTKEVGRGTGLGLATVHGIVKQSRGDIWVYSEPGHGTTFKIYLPAASAPGDDGAAIEQADGEGPGPLNVLVVEDDEAVRTLVRAMLVQGGHRVLVAGDPKEALRVAAASSGTIDLLLSDVVMPESDGPPVYESLLREHPGLRVLYMSGYADVAVIQQGILAEGAPFIQKPFTPDGLRAKLREVFART